MFAELVASVTTPHESPAFSGMVERLFDIKELVALPFSRESLLWWLSAVRCRFGEFLCSIYAKNSPKNLPDHLMIEVFVTQWQKYFEELKPPALFMRLSRNFIYAIEWPLCSKAERGLGYATQAILSCPGVDRGALVPFGAGGLPDVT